MEDRRAHERIEELDKVVRSHLADHTRFEETLEDISRNTAELVELVRGAKGLRSFVIWAAPLAAAIAALWAWAKSQ